MKHAASAPAPAVEKITLPEILAVSLRPSPAHIRGGGWRGFVTQPGHPLNDTLVLFPHDGKGMQLIPHQVAFITVTSVIHKISPSSGKPYLSAPPIGERSFADLKAGREAAKGIIRDDIERYLAKGEAVRSANQAFEKVERSGRIPFVTPNHQAYGVSKFNLALQQANHEMISAFAQTFAELSEVQAPSNVIIGGRITLGGRHDCVMCVAGLELAAVAAAYLTGLGWWVASAYLSPDQSQWCFVMTSTPPESFDYDPTPANCAAAGNPRQEHHKKAVPQRVATVKPHVPATARPKPAVVAPSFDLIALLPAVAETTEEPQTPIVEVSPLAMVVVQSTAAPVNDEVIDEVTATPEEPISDKEMDQASGFVGQADKDETNLLYAALHHLSRNNMGNLRVATKATIAELPLVEITDENRETIMMTTVPMFLAATPGWTAAVAMELATAGMVG